MVLTPELSENPRHVALQAPSFWELAFQCPLLTAAWLPRIPLPPDQTIALANGDAQWHSDNARGHFGATLRFVGRDHLNRVAAPEGPVR